MRRGTGRKTIRRQIERRDVPSSFWRRWDFDRIFFKDHENVFMSSTYIHPQNIFSFQKLNFFSNNDNITNEKIRKFVISFVKLGHWEFYHFLFILSEIIWLYHNLELSRILKYFYKILKHFFLIERKLVAI